MSGSVRLLNKRPRKESSESAGLLLTTEVMVGPRRETAGRLLL